MMLSSSAYSRKVEQHIFYMWDPLEVIRAQIRLAGKDQVFTMLRSWNLYNCKAMHETCESRVHTMDALFSKTVFECVRKHVTTSTYPLPLWHDGKGASITTFVEMVQDYTDKATTSLKANATVHIPYILFSLTV